MVDNNASKPLLSAQSPKRTFSIPVFTFLNKLFGRRSSDSNLRDARGFSPTSPIHTITQDVEGMHISERPDSRQPNPQYRKTTSEAHGLDPQNLSSRPISLNINPRTASSHLDFGYFALKPFNSPASPPSIASTDTSSIKIPFRNASIQFGAVDTLLNEGTQSIYPQQNLMLAVEKWNACLEMSLKAHDLITSAKALSNISCAYRNQGNNQQALLYVHRAWSCTQTYILNSSNEQVIISTWLRLAMGAFEIPIPLKSEINFLLLTERSTGTKELFNGPPIIIWIFKLMNNIGNIQFSLGDYEMAMKSFESLLSLVKLSLNEFPYPQELMEIANASRNMLIEAEYPDPGVYNISVFHRQAFLAQARSTSHLGTCFSALGLSTAALQYQISAHHFCTKMISKVPSLVIQANVSVRTSSNTSAVLSDMFEIIILRSSILGNLGCAWHATGNFGKATTWHERSCRLFSSLHPVDVQTGIVSSKLGIEEARQLSNIAVLYVSIGQCIKAIDIINNLAIKSPKETEVHQNHFAFTNTLLYAQANRQNYIHDRLGLHVSLLNICISFLNKLLATYISNNHFWHFHIYPRLYQRNELMEPILDTRYQFAFYRTLFIYPLWFLSPYTSH